MASRFWVGGTGNWNGTNTTNWSTTSGGTGGVAVPTSSDDVTFDSASNATAYTVTVATVQANCKSLTMGAPASGKVTWAGVQTTNIFGSLNLSGGTAGITNSYTGNIVFTTATGQTVTTNGVAMASNTSFTNGGSWQLIDGYANPNNKTITLTTTASLDTNGQTVTCSNFQASDNTTLTLGASSFTCNGLGSSGNFTLGNLTSFNAGTSSISANTAISGSIGYTFYDVTFTPTAAVATNFSFGAGDGSATNCHNITVTTSTKVANLFAPLNVIASGTVSLSGNSTSNRLLLFSNDLSIFTLTISAAVVSLTNVDFIGVTATGAGTWSGTSVGDGGGNTGITFTSPVTRFYVGGTGNFSDTTHWSTSSGGSSGASNPLGQDTAVFDTNSFTSDGLTLTCDSYILPSLDFTNINHTLNVAQATTPSLNHFYAGSFILNAGITYTNNSVATILTGRGSYILDSKGATITIVGDSFQINCPGGTYTLGSALTIGGSNGLISFNRGTFTTANNDITSVGFNAVGSISTTFLNLGSSLITVSGANSAWNLSGTTINAGTSTIKFTNATSTNKTFAGGGKTYYNLYFTGAGTGTFTLTGNNTFNNFKVDTPPHTIRFTAGTTNTFTTFTVSGTAGNLMTITSLTTGAHTLQKVSGGINFAPVSCDYMNIQHSIALPDTATWYAGTHSTNNQAVVTAGRGWIFTDPSSNFSSNGFFGFMDENNVG